MRKLIFILSAVLFTVLSAAGQNRTISGKVTDEKGTPVDGVSVASSDGKHGTSTGKDGTFSISVPATVKTLVFTQMCSAVFVVPAIWVWSQRESELALWFAGLFAVTLLFGAAGSTLATLGTNRPRRTLVDI